MIFLINIFFSRSSFLALQTCIVWQRTEFCTKTSFNIDKNKRYCHPHDFTWLEFRESARALVRISNRPKGLQNRSLSQKVIKVISYSDFSVSEMEKTRQYGRESKERKRNSARTNYLAWWCSNFYLNLEMATPSEIIERIWTESSEFPKLKYCDLGTSTKTMFRTNFKGTFIAILAHSLQQVSYFNWRMEKHWYKKIFNEHTHSKYTLHSIQKYAAATLRPSVHKNPTQINTYKHTIFKNIFESPYTRVGIMSYLDLL